MIEGFVYGVVFGCFLYTVWSVIKKIFKNAWDNTLPKSGCTHDCNQGRTCTCGDKEKNNGIS